MIINGNNYVLKDHMGLWENLAFTLLMNRKGSYWWTWLLFWASRKFRISIAQLLTSLMSLYLNNYKRFHKGFEALGLWRFSRIWGLTCLKKVFKWKFEAYLEGSWLADLELKLCGSKKIWIPKYLGAWHVWRNLTCGNVRSWRSFPRH